MPYYNCDCVYTAKIYWLCNGKLLVIFEKDWLVIGTGNALDLPISIFCLKIGKNIAIR